MSACADLLVGLLRENESIYGMLSHRDHPLFTPKIAIWRHQPTPDIKIFTVKALAHNSGSNDGDDNVHDNIDIIMDYSYCQSPKKRL